MLPLLLRLTFETPLARALLYAVLALAVALLARSGWHNASARGGGAPTAADRRRAALQHGAGGVLVALVGLRFALPPSSGFPGAQGTGLPLHSYGLLMGVGFFTAVMVAARLAQDEWRRLAPVTDAAGHTRLMDVEGPRRREQVMDLLVWVFVGGLVGSGVLYALVNAGETALVLRELGGALAGLRPVDVVAALFRLVFRGFVFYGGLMGAALGALLFARRHGLAFLRLADVALPTVSLGQAFGRLGCFAAGCCWGGVAPKGTAWAVQFPGAELVRDVLGRPTEVASAAFGSQAGAGAQRWVLEASGQVLSAPVPGAVNMREWVLTHGHTFPVYPTQLLEAAGQVVLFVLLLWLRRTRRFHGHVTALWLMGYALLRTGVELLRGDLERGTLHGLLAALGADGLAARVPEQAWFNVSTSQAISLALFGVGAGLLWRGLTRRAAPGAAAAPPPTVTLDPA